MQAIQEASARSLGQRLRLRTADLQKTRIRRLKIRGFFDPWFSRPTKWQSAGFRKAADYALR
jgi:hypothetical protein